jgi:hypothetical protein
MNELPIIQKTYDLVKWYIPIITRFPRVHKFTLGDRLMTALYELLEGLIIARYAQNKLQLLQQLNGKLDIIRHQTRLLHDLNIIDIQRYEYIGKQVTEIGNELGGWIKQQPPPQQQKPQQQPRPTPPHKKELAHTPS